MKIFLSYASQDSAKVRALAAKLSKDGFSPWIDESHISAGSDWKVEIEKALESADAVIACLSEASTSKTGYVQKEFRYTLELAELRPEGAYFLFPVKLEPCEVPRSMRSKHYVNLFEDDGYIKLVDGLRRTNEPPLNKYNVLIIANSGLSSDRFEKCVTGADFVILGKSAFSTMYNISMSSLKDGTRIPGASFPDLLIDDLNDYGIGM
jgi:hypothetical protein